MHSDPLLGEKVVDENTDRNSASIDGDGADENQGKVGKLDVAEPGPLANDFPEGGTWGWLAVLGVRGILSFSSSSNLLFIHFSGFLSFNIDFRFHKFLECAYTCCLLVLTGTEGPKDVPSVLSRARNCVPFSHVRPVHAIFLLNPLIPQLQTLTAHGLAPYRYYSGLSLLLEPQN